MISGKYKNDSGFVALITAIILSAVLLIIVITLNQTSFFTRGILIDSESKERSAALAEACVDIAMLKLANNPTYGGDEPAVSIGSDSCEIFHIDPLLGGQQTIETKGIFNGATTNLSVVVDVSVSDISVHSWTEIENF